MRYVIQTPRSMIPWLWLWVGRFYHTEVSTLAPSLAAPLGFFRGHFRSDRIRPRIDATVEGLNDGE